MRCREQIKGEGNLEESKNNERRLKFSKNYHLHKVKEFHVYDTIECFAKELSKQKKRS